MGACLSCLGLGRDPTDQESRDTERLLYDNDAADRGGYGTVARGAQSREDPEELRRQQKQLEQICADTNHNLIDIEHTTLLTLRGKPSSEFASLLNQQFPPTSQSPPPTSSATATNSSSPYHAAFSQKDRNKASQNSSAQGDEDEDEPPRTPNPNNFPSSPPEPPSPFTRAQLAAAQASQNGSSRTPAGNSASFTTPTAGVSYAQATASGGSPAPGPKRQGQGPSNGLQSNSIRGRRPDTAKQNGAPSDNVHEYEVADSAKADDTDGEEAWLASIIDARRVEDAVAVKGPEVADGSLIVQMIGPEDDEDDDSEDEGVDGTAVAPAGR